MVKTLKALKAKVLRNPEDYGKGDFFRNKKPYCPIAKEIIPDAYGIGSYVTLAAERLKCNRQDIWDFTEWWDDLPRFNN